MNIEILRLYRLSPGFAISEGLTAERALVNAATGIRPDILISHFGHVSISHAIHEVIIY